MLHKCQEVFNEKEYGRESLNSSLEEEVRRRSKIMSNIQFIGELFIRKMITDKLLVNCMDLLISYATTDSFENFLILFKKVAYLLKDKKVKMIDNKIRNLSY
mmetsp:Transcript_20247/g.44689  ORF Transcript_20247/g.44689 Transcript_20247/m.44689 type:complete len:102 (+) Transcript_20247:1760-2065(+)